MRCACVGGGIVHNDTTNNVVPHKQFVRVNATMMYVFIHRTGHKSLRQSGTKLKVMEAKKVEIKNGERITIIFNHVGYCDGSINVFVNDCNATKSVAKDLCCKLRQNGSIANCSYASYNNSYGQDIARRIRDFYKFTGDIKIFETTY